MGFERLSEDVDGGDCSLKTLCNWQVLGSSFIEGAWRQSESWELTSHFHFKRRIQLNNALLYLSILCIFNILPTRRKVVERFI